MDASDPTLTRLAQLEVQDQLYRYCRALDRYDSVTALDLWTESSLVDYDGVFTGSGPEFIGWVFDLHRQFDGHSHQITNVLIDMHGTSSASSEAYVTVALHRTADDGVVEEFVARGRYLDDWLLQGDGIWRIQVRSYVRDLLRTLRFPDAPHPAAEVPIVRKATRHSPE